MYTQRPTREPWWVWTNLGALMVIHKCLKMKPMSSEFGFLGSFSIIRNEGDNRQEAHKMLGREPNPYLQTGKSYTFLWGWSLWKKQQSTTEYWGFTTCGYRWGGPVSNNPQEVMVIGPWLQGAPHGRVLESLLVGPENHAQELFPRGRVQCPCAADGRYLLHLSLHGSGAVCGLGGHQDVWERMPPTWSPTQQNYRMQIDKVQLLQSLALTGPSSLTESQSLGLNRRKMDLSPLLSPQGVCISSDALAHHNNNKRCRKSKPGIYIEEKIIFSVFYKKP